MVILSDLPLLGSTFLLLRALAWLIHALFVALEKRIALVRLCKRRKVFVRNLQIDIYKLSIEPWDNCRWPYIVLEVVK